MELLIIAPWGTPKKGEKWRWDIAHYSSEDEKSSILSRSSLTLLTLQALERDFNPHILIVAPDTLYTSTELTPPTEYRELLRIVERWLRNCLREMGREAGLKPLMEAEIAILPGIGRFRREGREFIFKSKLSDFRLLAYLKILRRLIEGGFKEVWIDLTHGINYSTTLTYRSTIDALEALALYEGRTVEEMEERLRVYNSDPYDKERGREQELTIHEIRGVGLKAIEPPTTQELKILGHLTPISKLLKIESKGEEAKEISSHIKKLLKPVDAAMREIKDDILTVVGSLEKGAMLPLKTLINPENLRKASTLIMEVDEYINNTLTDKEITKITDNENMIRIIRKASLKHDVIPIMKSLSLSHHISTIIWEAKNWIPLSELKELLDRLRWLSGIVRTLSRKEYGELTRRIKKKLETGKKIDELRKGIKLSELIEGGEPFNKRNFIAHAGLERNVTKIRLREKPKQGEEIGKLMELVEVTYIDEGKVHRALVDPDP